MNVLILLISSLLYSTESKGLYSGVPCHRPYSCIFEENDDGFDNSILLAAENNVENEETCQTLCSDLENCVSFTWWNELANDHPDGSPFLCQLFAVCHRNYHDPDSTPVFSGPSQCRNPVIVFGGDGEDRIDPKMVETIWPGYDDGYDDSGYVTIGDFDDVPDIPEQSYGSWWWTSAVLLNDNMIMACGGGYPATNKCFGLDLVSGSWKSLTPMTFARTEGHTLLKLNNGIMVLGGGRNDLIEIYNSDFDFWTPMPQWNGPFADGLSRHCAVAIDDHRVMVLGGATTFTKSVSKIFDIRTGIWQDTSPNPNPRYGHACVLYTLDGVQGVMVTGGTEGRTDPNDYYPGSVTDFYQIETDSWISLANTSFPVENHQMVLYDGKPTIIGGEYEIFLREIEIEGRHMRDHVQIFGGFLGNDRWSCCVPSMNYKRSKFAAVVVTM